MGKENKGIGLIELCIVACIISMLLLITVPSIIKVRQLTEDIKTKTELRVLYTAFTDYFLQKSEYPKTFEDLELYLNNSEYYAIKYEINPNL